MKSLQRYLLLFIWGCLLGGGCSVCCNQAEAAPADSVSGKIVYQGDADGDWEIYALNAGGDRLIQLTDNEANDEQPSWSPDGQQIAFTSNRTGNYDIYVMSADGEDLRRLTHDASDEREPSWSPDGSAILFTSYRSHRSGSSLYTMKSDGTQRRRITSIKEHAFQATWSPDSSALMFSAVQYNLNWGLHLLDSQEERIIRLTGGNSSQGTWAPDGKQIAHLVTSATPRDFPKFFRIIDSRGNIQHEVFPHKNTDVVLSSWSPDGKALLFAQTYSQRVPHWELQALSVEEGESLQLAQYPVQGVRADWAHGKISEEILDRKNAPWKLKFLYEAEYVPHRVGRYLHDPDALNKRALFTHSGHNTGFLAYGPYTTFPAGEYSVLFRGKASDYSDDEAPIVRLDAVAEQGKVSLDQLLVKGSDFSEKERYHEFELTFVLTKPERLEFRAWSFARASVWLDRITVSATLKAGD